MIKVINYKNKNSAKILELFLNKRRLGKKKDTSIVEKIIRDVKKYKNKAVLKYEKTLSKNNKITTSRKEINESIKLLDPKVKKAIDFAYQRILKFHKLQKIKDINYVDKLKNKIQYKNVTIDSAGLYVPANLPSTALMVGIPAKIAGVKKIVLANPRQNGKLNPAVMYVAKKLKIKNILSIGGAQAIASMAYIHKTSKIFGPGGDIVAKAKQLVFGDVGIEGAIMGPSEVLVVADSSTDINQAITSIICQLEHGENSQSILISKNKKFIEKFKKNIFKEIDMFPRKKIISKNLKSNGLIIFAKDDKKALEAIQLIAPEHLELLNQSYKKYINKITNAGCIGVGKFSPVSASDYCVGVNHSLGVMGSARYASGLNLSDYEKKISIFSLTKKGIEVIGKKAITLAEYESLEAHAKSIKSRMRR
tara:strand:- start:565 stop:1827 length:1263 start_codon:yes stop_codon:yes gene_type:complete